MVSDAVMERLLRLEEGLRAAVLAGAPSAEQMSSAIHRHTMLSAREGHLAGWIGRSANAVLGNRLDQQDTTARELFPLPPKKVPRVLKDPHGTGEWRFRESVLELEWRPPGLGGWRHSHLGRPALTALRARMAADLMANPYTEVPDEGDE
jgi:hypothetical protein